jgi:hypothetical protein
MYQEYADYFYDSDEDVGTESVGSDSGPVSTVRERETHEDFMSKIRVIFNPKFRDFIIKLKRDLTYEISRLDSNVFEVFLDVQKNIREYIIENQHLIDMSSGVISEKSKPDLFAIAICIILPDLFDYNSFNEVLDKSHENRWSVSQCSSESNANFHSSIIKCVCSQNCRPENMYIINNLQTGLNLLIGSDCAKKTAFFEQEVLDKLKKERDNNPFYKKCLEKSEMINREKRTKNLEEGLQKQSLTIGKIKHNTDFEYAGGINGEHLVNLKEYCAKAKMNYIETEEFIGSIQEMESCVCKQKIPKNKIVVVNQNDGEQLILCNPCCEILEINIPKSKKGHCEDCGEKHKNRSDNYCSNCRQKKNCIKCGIREFCNSNDLCSECTKFPCKTCKKRGNHFGKRCQECSINSYCADCDNEKVNKKGYRCNPCFNKLPKCACGKIIDKKYTQCYSCKMNKKK